MKKICHLTSTSQNSIPRILREASTALTIGLKPYIVAPGRTYEKDGIHYLGVPVVRNRIGRMMFSSFILFLIALRVDADIYHIHDPELLFYGLLLKRIGKKVVFDSHEFYGIQIENKEYIPQALRRPISHVYCLFEEYICRRLDAVIAVCTINNGMDYFAGRSQQTVFCANLPRMEIFTTAKAKNTVKRDDVIYIGAISENRGIVHLMEAIKKTSGKLILCGPSFSEAILKGLTNDRYAQISYMGILSQHEVAKLLNECNIGISTLLNVGQYHVADTLATKVYEYMASGMPVILSDTPYNIRLAKEIGFAICVNPADPDQIADAINFLINNPEIAQTMGARGATAVRAMYNWKIEEQKLISLYEKLLGLLPKN